MNRYLIWLNWPEKCFRISTDDLRYLRTLVPKGSRVVRVRDDTGFMRALPRATHAIVWRFRREWFARASRLRVLATPAAGQELVPTAGPPGVTIHFGHYHGAIMAESVAGFMLAWSRGFFAVRYAPPRVAAWPRTWLSERCAEVAGTTAVIATIAAVRGRYPTARRNAFFRDAPSRFSNRARYGNSHT